MRNGSIVSQTLVETWNGTAWSITTSPNEGSYNNLLRSVSCVSPTDCVAVGYYSNLAGDQLSLVEAWDGSIWSIISSPSPSSNENRLYSVSCTSSTFCEAVGLYDINTTTLQTLIETWDGTTWSVTPNSDAASDLLNGVSCTSPTFCEAVGYNDEEGPSLIETWDGTSWSVTTSPDPGTYNDLNGVSCTSVTSCVAVGDYGSGALPNTLVESWNGTAWSVVSSPDPAQSTLFGVSCASPISCVAVGDYSKPSEYVTLVESWDGTSWSDTSSPNADQNAKNRLNELISASCTSQINCVSVGYFRNGSTKTLVEAGTTPPPTITRFTPKSGAPGVIATIFGTHLENATVAFNGTVATIVIDTAKMIDVTVPTGATTGTIEVTTPGGSVTSATDFSVT